MAVLTFPTGITPSGSEWWLQSNTLTFTSPLSGTTQTTELPGARWKAALQFTNLSESKARELLAFLAQLRGTAGRFYLYDHAHPQPRGTALGTPLVDGSGQTGATVNTRLWTANQTGLLLPGDFVSISGELKIVTAQVDSDSSGKAAVTFEPPMRFSATDGNPIIIDKPTASFFLDKDEAKMTNRLSGHSNISFSCTEALL